MPITLDWMHAPFMQFRKNWSWDQMVAALLARNTNKAISAFSGSLESGSQFRVGCIWQESGCGWCRFGFLNNEVWRLRNRSRVTLYRDNAAMNCTTVEHKKRFIPISLDGSHTQLVYICCMWYLTLLNMINLSCLIVCLLASHHD